jgi:recombination protein RecA
VAKKKPDENPKTTLMAALAKLGVGSLLQFANEASDAEVLCVSTGFPQLDYILHPQKKGWPRGRNIEIYSLHESAGKTSLALKFIAKAQQQKLRCMFADIEDTMDKAYLAQQGCDLQSLLFMQAPSTGPLPAEVWLETIKKVSPELDLIGIDSVAALELQGNLEKEMDENDKVAGIPLMMSGFLKKNLAKRASILWVNQSRSAIGGYSPAGSPAPTTTTGGKALPFYCSLRLQLTEVAKIKGPGGEHAPPVGIKVRVFCKKNKIAAPYRQCELSYVYGYGFSPVWDYMEFGMKLGVVEKNGSWYNFNGQRSQGEMALHGLLLKDPVLYEKLQRAVDGDDALTDSTVSQGEEPESPEDAAA